MAKTRAYKLAIGAVLVMLIAALPLVGCVKVQSVSASGSAAGQSSAPEAADRPAPSPAASTAREEVAPRTPLAYPTGWLISDEADIPACVPCQVLYAPELDVVPHRDGVAIGEEERAILKAAWPDCPEDCALVEHEGQVVAVPDELLLVNLPDVVPQAVYDIVYSYASTSNCAGQAIPGVTGEQIPGYVDGAQPNDYLGREQFVVPCAFGTAVKAAQAEAALEAQGYRLLVYDAYRPMTAQAFLSQALDEAYGADPAIRDGLGSWGLTWYVASGASGHNYGTDLDVGVCDGQGNALAMPSAFDSFDEAGHLTGAPMNAAAITPAAYREEVASNPACLALHQVFTEVGFTELASEWWHFADDETEASSRGIVGGGGLDFTADLG